MNVQPFAELLANVKWDWTEEERRESGVCSLHPEKVRKTNILDALDGLIQRFRQPSSHIRRTYKCPACKGWHYTHHPYTPSTKDPFPRPWWYGVVIDGKKIWQSSDQREAQRFARKHRGTVRPFMDGHW